MSIGSVGGVTVRVCLCVDGSILFTQDSQLTKQSGTTWKNSSTSYSMGKIREFGEKCFKSREIREFDCPRRESVQSVIDSFSDIVFTQA